MAAPGASRGAGPQRDHALYRAVYGMNPEVVNYVIAQRGENDLASSWQACEKHNKKHYRQTFLNMKFAPDPLSESSFTSHLSMATTAPHAVILLEGGSHPISSPQEVLKESTPSQECKKEGTYATSISDSSNSLGSVASTATPPLSSVPPSSFASGFTFFQKHKPAVIKNATPSELELCIKTFQALFDVHHYTFSVKRTQATQLMLEFTTQQKGTEDHEKITEHLRAAATTFQQLVSASGIPLKSNQFKLNGEKCTLTIDATSAEIDGMAWCLQQASGKYIAENKNSFTSDYEAVCRMQ